MTGIPPGCESLVRGRRSSGKVTYCSHDVLRFVVYVIPFINVVLWLTGCTCRERLMMVGSPAELTGEFQPARLVNSGSVMKSAHGPQATNVILLSAERGTRRSA